MGDWNWCIHATIYKKITNKSLLYSTGKSTQYSVMTYIGMESKKEWIYMCVCVYVCVHVCVCVCVCEIHFAIQEKLYCNSTIL